MHDTYNDRDSKTPNTYPSTTTDTYHRENTKTNKQMKRCLFSQRVVREKHCSMATPSYKYGRRLFSKRKKMLRQKVRSGAIVAFNIHTRSQRVVYIRDTIHTQQATDQSSILKTIRVVSKQ